MDKNVTMMQTFTPAAVRWLFEREALVFGFSCGVPYARSVELFGEDAVEFVKGLETASARLIGGYGIGRFTAYYLTRDGIYAAASYCNACAVERIGGITP